MYGPKEILVDFWGCFSQARSAELFSYSVGQIAAMRPVDATLPAGQLRCGQHSNVLRTNGKLGFLRLVILVRPSVDLSG